jgi:hypothetical protein
MGVDKPYPKLIIKTKNYGVSKSTIIGASNFLMLLHEESHSEQNASFSDYFKYKLKYEKSAWDMTFKKYTQEYGLNEVSSEEIDSILKALDSYWNDMDLSKAYIFHLLDKYNIQIIDE